MDTHLGIGDRCVALTDFVSLRTDAPQQFIDVTELVAQRVRRSKARSGLASVQTCHPMTAVVVNDDGPGLLDDSVLMGVAQVVHVAEGTLRLSPRQRIFFVELDGPRERTLSIVVLGLRGGND